MRHSLLTHRGPRPQTTRQVAPPAGSPLLQPLQEFADDYEVFVWERSLLFVAMVAFVCDALLVFFKTINHEGGVKEKTKKKLQ